MTLVLQSVAVPCKQRGGCRAKDVFVREGKIPVGDNLASALTGYSWRLVLCIIFMIWYFRPFLTISNI